MIYLPPNPLDVVTIIIPVYNRAEYLHSCLLSIAEQTYPAIEVIVVDDASSDDLSCVVNSIEWPSTFTIKYIRLDENRGPGYAREVGRQHATGAYINYQDSDDLFHNEKIATQVAILQNNPEAGMCYCITLNFITYPFTGDERLRRSHYIDKILPGLLQKRPWATGSCLWTRVATEIIGPWSDDRREEDFLYEVRAGCKDISIIYVPKILMYVRCHFDEAERRMPSKQVYQQAIATYHRALDDLNTYGKLEDPRCLLAMTREIFRVCRKLFVYQDMETAFSILRYLLSSGRSKLKTQNFYFFFANIILLNRHFVPKKYQPLLFSRLCEIAMRI